jgi:hypothetical protein
LISVPVFGFIVFDAEDSIVNQCSNNLIAQLVYLDLKIELIRWARKTSYL